MWFMVLTARRSYRRIVEKVIAAMATPDGRWRVEVVRRNGADWYRVRHGESVADGLAIASVRRILEDAGVDLGDLLEVAA